jgi:serine/threonine protein kinase
VSICPLDAVQVEHEEIVDEFGDLESTMAMNIKQKQQHHRQSLGSAPATFSALQLCGCVSSDRFGSLVLAQYNARSPNLCLKTFFLDSKEILVLKHDIMNMVDTSHALKTLRESSDHFPALLASYRDNNAYHLLFAAPIVASLESLLVQGNDRIRHLDFIAAAVISALEDLHKAGIVYRSIQPEGIHLDASGKVVLLEYSSSKVDGVGKQTFTLCGAPDYMAPEQVSQQGHNESVDFWALGVLLYELFTGENPFIPSGNVTELGIFLKISSFGKPQFPRLSLTEMPDSLADLISHLVVTDPCARLGMGSGGIESLKRHPFFQNVSFDADYFLNPSPLKEWAEEVQSDLMEEGIPADLIEQWNRGEESHNNWINDFLVQD